MINNNMHLPDDFTLYFAVPGDIRNLTGGYGYDRELIKELIRLGIHVQLLALSAEFPNPSAATLITTAQLFADLPTGATVIVDGLVFGVMDEIAARESQRLKLIALCHHPLALETGITALEAQQLKTSETRAIAAARAAIVTSAMTARILMSDFAVPSTKITLAWPGTPSQPVFAACDNDTPLLLTLATLTKRKGHDLLIHALAQLTHLPWHARFVGGMNFDPQWAAYLQQLVAKNNLQGRVHFVGNVDNVRSEFLHADLFVLPTYFEGYGMAFAEALAFGLPIIGTNAGALPDLIPADAGILVPAGDEQALTDALQQLLSIREYRLQLRAGAQRAAQTLPSWQDCAQRVAALIFRVRKL